MPDPTVDAPEAPEREYRPEPALDRPPILACENHPYRESEFPEGKGHCDTCGGGPQHPIHAPKVDQLERIANALEGIQDVLNAIWSKLEDK